MIEPPILLVLASDLRFLIWPQQCCGRWASAPVAAARRVLLLNTRLHFSLYFEVRKSALNTMQCILTLYCLWPPSPSQPWPPPPPPAASWRTWRRVQPSDGRLTGTGASLLRKTLLTMYGVLGMKMSLCMFVNWGNHNVISVGYIMAQKYLK